MISKNQIKLITSLQHKKFRTLHNLFIAEGIKTINELLNSHFKLHQLYTVLSFNNNLESEVIVSETELKKISSLKTPNMALALFEIPKPNVIDKSKLIVALDDVRDPGNLGTIIRLCDWFGIKDLICSEETVDCFNPKVIQATMGSITRVNINYVDLPKYLLECKVNKMGAFMNETNVYKTVLPETGILVLGNEAKGISKKVEVFLDEKISIPQFGINRETESLNVATATAILLSEFKRNSIEM